jgi:hypothetical protein
LTVKTKIKFTNTENNKPHYNPSFWNETLTKKQGESMSFSLYATRNTGNKNAKVGLN